MYIDKVYIKNFRGFGHDADDKGFVIDLNDGITSIIGKNGSGKTTILEAIHYVLGQEYLNNKISEKDFNPLANNLDDEIEIIVKTKEPFFYTLEAKSNTRQQETFLIPCQAVRLSIHRRKASDTVNLKILDDPYIIDRTVIPLTGTINPDIYDTESSNRKPIKINRSGTSYKIEYLLGDGQSRSASIFDYQLNYIPSKSKNCPKAIYLSKSREQDTNGTYSFVSKIFTDLHWKFRKNNDSEREEITTLYNSLINKVREAVGDKGELFIGLNQTIKEITTENIDASMDVLDIEQPYSTAYISTKRESKSLEIESRGAGYNIIAAYALFKYIADKEKTPIVLLIDEPELHLHTDWERNLYTSLGNQSVLQGIYSTQSESFISLKKWEEIRLLSNFVLFPTASTLQNKIKIGEGEALVSEFLDDYAVKNLHISLILRENLELFFTDKIIIVEGPGDKYALQKLLELKGIALNDYSVAIIPSWGKTKIKVYQMICKAFGKNYYTVFDKDKEESENDTIEGNILYSQMTKFSTSLEKLLGITGDEKFQKLVEIVDSTEDLNTLDTEIQSAIGEIETFITTPLF